MTGLNDELTIHRREERLIARVIDGEAIIVDFKTGDHYSLNQIGTLGGPFDRQEKDHFAGAVDDVLHLGGLIE